VISCEQEYYDEYGDDDDDEYGFGGFGGSVDLESSATSKPLF